MAAGALMGDEELTDQEIAVAPEDSEAQPLGVLPREA
jgi:hypothetical protein